MKNIQAFFLLIRWPNLVVIILAQLFLHYFIIGNLAHSIQLDLSLTVYQLLLLVFSTVLIAAAANILNDVDDLKIDRLNKPDKVIIGKFINAPLAIRIAWIFNAIAFLMSLFLAYQLHFIQLALIQMIVILLLKRYAQDFKNKPLIGNMLVALFTALSIFIVYLYNLVSVIEHPILFASLQKQLPLIFLLTQAYVFFAFMSNMIRELVKDIEDIEGDSVFQLRTFPIVYGRSKSMFLVKSLNIVLILGLLVFSAYAFLMNWFYLGVYLIVAVLFPTFYFQWKSSFAKSREDYKNLSFLSKIIMLAGILSMQVFSLQF
jgi:4-hydroxybenzoate polyprenyltransferase